jgi:hypothetical protein
MKNKTQIKEPNIKYLSKTIIKTELGYNVIKGTEYFMSL